MAIPALILADGGADLLVGLAIFIFAAFLMAFGALLVGRFIRPRLPHPDKEAPYECGELVMGKAWVQFDLRFYVVALVFLVFDVEVALFYPWAVVFGRQDQQVKSSAMFDMLFFFAILVVGFLYLWRFGYLNWVWAGSRPTSAKDVE